MHDRAQVFISCPSRADGGRVSYVGTIERWSNQAIYLPNAKCVSNTSLFILVTNCPLALNTLMPYDILAISSLVFFFFLVLCNC